MKAEEVPITKLSDSESKLLYVYTYQHQIWWQTKNIIKNKSNIRFINVNYISKFRAIRTMHQIKNNLLFHCKNKLINYI